MGPGLSQGSLHQDGHYHHVPQLHEASHCSTGADENRLNGFAWDDMAETFPFRVAVASSSICDVFIGRLPFRVRPTLVRCSIVKGYLAVTLSGGGRPGPSQGTGYQGSGLGSPRQPPGSVPLLAPLPGPSIGAGPLPIPLLAPAPTLPFIRPHTAVPEPHLLTPFPSPALTPLGGFRVVSCIFGLGNILPHMMFVSDSAAQSAEVRKIKQLVKKVAVRVPLPLKRWRFASHCL